MEKIARVAIVGGGLAGLAAAVALTSRGAEVELFEARRSVGGRVASLEDPQTGEEVDYCLHLARGCDANFAKLVSQIGASKNFQRLSKLHFFGPDGKRSDLSALPGFPAPLHLAARFLQLGFLTFKERWAIVKVLRELAGPLAEEDALLSVLRWLRLRDQSPRAIERFWSTALTGALGEKLDQVSLQAARKVVLNRFMLHRSGYTLEVATKPMREALIEPACDWLEASGAKVHLASPVRLVLGSPDRCQGLLLSDGETRAFDVVIVAAPWHGLSSLLSQGLHSALPQLPKLDEWKPSAITGVHLWFDRPLSPLTHAILVEGLTQWVFRRHPRATADMQGGSGFYYQVLLNPAAELEHREPESLLDEVQRDLAKIWPACRDAKLLRSRIVTDRQALFPSAPECDDWRPAQETAIPNLMLAGDWTKTGWPSTMESAVRSGNLAAEAVLRYLGRPAKILAPDLAPEWLARRLFPLAT